MNAAEFMATFSNAVRETSVSKETVWLASSRELQAKLDDLEGFAARSACQLMPYEVELCAEIRSELAKRIAYGERS